MIDAVKKIGEFEKFGSVLGLERMEALMELLGNPHENLKVIHVAGTNGKGSVCAYIYSVLQRAGYKCGLFISPYVHSFNERIQFNGRYIDDDELSEYTALVLEKAEILSKKGIQPTEFEIVTSIAIKFYSDMKADLVILEVGLGGRGDSTNIIRRPLASLITSISFDHADRLGNTIAQIASEKAGIIKSGCPVITTATDDEAVRVIENKANELNSSIYRPLTSDVKVVSMSLKGTKFIFCGDEYEISMVGRHQVDNAICAIKALEVLKDQGKITYEEESLKEGLIKAKQIGRFEIIKREPLTVIDGAHNEDGARALREAVSSLIEKNQRILLITGVLADKDVDSICSHFSEFAYEIFTVSPQNERAMDSRSLADIYKKAKKTVRAFDDLEEAIKLAYDRAEKKQVDAIIFAGSLYLIAQVRSILIDE